MDQHKMKHTDAQTVDSKEARAQDSEEGSAAGDSNISVLIHQALVISVR